MIQLVIAFDQFVVSSLYKDLLVPQRLKFLELWKIIASNSLHMT